MLKGIEDIRIQGTDFLPRILRRDFEDTAAVEFTADGGEGGLDGAGVVAIGNVEKEFIVDSAYGDIEVLWAGFHGDTLLAIMIFEEAHYLSGG